jgi:RIO kinase 1
VEAGVRVPKPFGYFNDTLMVELVTDAAGDLAPASANLISRPKWRASITRF